MVPVQGHIQNCCFRDMSKVMMRKNHYVKPGAFATIVLSEMRFLFSQSLSCLDKGVRRTGLLMQLPDPGPRGWEHRRPLLLPFGSCSWPAQELFGELLTLAPVQDSSWRQGGYSPASWVKTFVPLRVMSPQSPRSENQCTAPAACLGTCSRPHTSIQGTPRLPWGQKRGKCSPQHGKERASV